MTLVVTINGPETIWLMADRRLSHRGRVTKDDARKIMFLETTDGVAILGYAGLGSTAAGTEPADWMSAVMRGRKLPLEKSLGVIADAMKKEFPRHMLRVPGRDGPAHNVIAPAFLGEEARIYTIDMVFAPDRKSYKFRYTRHVNDKPVGTKPRTPRLGIGGSGALYLMQNKRWMRELLRLVRACDRGKLRHQAVADQLAAINYEVHQNMKDNSVGPRCIVAWRNRKGGIHKGGGAQSFYLGAKPDRTGGSLPTIANGMDVQALVDVLMPRFVRWKPGEPPPDINTDEINAELAKLPDRPDDKLR
jgi:hypothetical protein